MRRKEKSRKETTRQDKTREEKGGKELKAELERKVRRYRYCHSE